MKARNSLGRSISLLNDAEPARQPPTGLLRAMSDSHAPVNYSPVSTYQSESHPSPPGLLRTESSGSSIRRTPTPPTPCTIDEMYHAYPSRATHLLEKLPYPSPLHQRNISRSNSDDSEWLLSPPASPRPLKTSLTHHAKRDAHGRILPSASPVSPRHDDLHWAEPPHKLDKRRHTWSPPPEQTHRPRISLPVRNRDRDVLSPARPPTDEPPASPARAQQAAAAAAAAEKVVVHVSIDSSLQEGVKPRRRYACPVGMCAKTFSTSGHASRHAKTHEGRREHVCGECFKRFGRKDNMRQHMTTHAPQNQDRRASGSGSGKRRKSCGGAPGDGGGGGGGGGALVPLLAEPNGAQQPSAMDLLAAAAAVAEYPAVGDLTLR